MNYCKYCWKTIHPMFGIVCLECEELRDECLRDLDWVEETFRSITYFDISFSNYLKEDNETTKEKYQTA